MQLVPMQLLFEVVCDALTHQRGSVCPAEVVLYRLVVQPDPLVVLCVCCVRQKC